MKWVKELPSKKTLYVRLILSKKNTTPESALKENCLFEHIARVYLEFVFSLSFIKPRAKNSVVPQFDTWNVIFSKLLEWMLPQEPLEIELLPDGTPIFINSTLTTPHGISSLKSKSQKLLFTESGWFLLKNISHKNAK